MQAASLEILENANVPAPQARAIVRSIEIEIASAHEELLRRRELDQERVRLRSEFRTARGRYARNLWLAVLGETAAIAVIVYFLVAHL